MRIRKHYMMGLKGLGTVKFDAENREQAIKIANAIRRDKAHEDTATLYEIMKNIKIKEIKRWIYWE